MGGFLQGLGEIAEGGIKGYEFAENMKDKIAARKEKDQERKNKKQYEESMKGVKNIYVEETPVQSQGINQFAQEPTQQTKQPEGAMSYGLGSLDYMQEKQPIQMSNYKNGGMVRKYADGGLVSMAADPEGVSYKTNIAAGLNSVQPVAPVQQPVQQEQSAAPAQNRKIDFGRTQSARMNAARDKALELGDFKSAQDFQEVGFKFRDDMFKKSLPMAQQVFAKTGDISGYVKLYNDTHDDGYNVESHTKNDDGTYALKMRDPSGAVQDMNMTPDEMKQMVYQLSNPAARYAGEMEALKERASATFKTDEEIRKKNAEGYTLNQGDKRFVSGKLEADNPKADGGLSDLLDVQKAAENPADPNFDIANKILARQKEEKISTATAMRAPRAEREPSFERMAYEDWAAEPQNKGKGRNQYLREKANWSQSEPLDSVTQSTERYDGEGNVVKESRTSKVKPQKPQSPQMKQYLDVFNKYKGNPKAQAEVTALFTAKGIVK